MLVPVVDVALFAIGEVVATVGDNNDCVGSEDVLIVASVGEELSLEDAAAAEFSSLDFSFGSPPQDSGSVGAFIRS